MNCSFARCLCLFVVSCLVTATGVLAQGSGAAAPAASAPAADACRRDVLKYQSHLDFVRKSLGDQEADALAAKFMTRAEWEALLQKEGYCGLSRRLRAQKLI